MGKLSAPMENWEIHGNSKNPGFWINLRFFSDAPAFLAVSVSLGSECVFNMHDQESHFKNLLFPINQG